MYRRILRLTALVPMAALFTSCLETTEPVVTTRNVPQSIQSTRTFADITAGDFHTCGLSSTNEAYCWGLNQQGQSGNGVGGEIGVTTPLPVEGGFLFSKIYAGGAWSCGIRTDAVSVCWGENSGGQLGNNSVISRFEPFPVSGEISFAMLSLSTAAHTCGVSTTGVAYCWGKNEFGAIGDGSQTDRQAPTPVAGGLTFLSISAGGAHTCGVTTSNDLYCWGYNHKGQIGDGTDTTRTSPVQVTAGSQKYIAVAAGLSHTCALRNDGQAFCWGDNIVGAVGDGSFVNASTPQNVFGGHTFKALVAGERHNCAITTADSFTLCWGFNTLGGLGDGTYTSRNVPVNLATPAPLIFVKLAAGGYHTCGITAAGKTYCWGDNTGQQLGSDQ